MMSSTQPFAARALGLSLLLAFMALVGSSARASFAGDPCLTDTDGDGVVDCLDGCPLDPLKIAAGICGCGVADTDTDGDGTADCNDGCPLDPLKIAPGPCGCGVADTDSDGDGTANCLDGCPLDPLKIAAGPCGCGVADTDNDGDGTANCLDGCPNDPLKVAAGICDCGVADTDTDGDGTADCNDGCPLDPLKTAPGACGCGAPDVLHTYYRDNDGDLFGSDSMTVLACSLPIGYVEVGGDCNDDNDLIHPGAVEICGNHIDDDCDGLVDEGPISRDRVMLENLLTGNPPSEWDVVDSGDPSIQGYAMQTSVRGGSTIDFKVKTDATSYRIEIYRIGWYGGNGARRIVTLNPAVTLPQVQPSCVTSSPVGLVDCGNWAVSASWSVPCDVVSGVYVAKLIRQDPTHVGKASHIHFVVRDDESHSDVVFQTSDTTWQAYNSYGGASLYRDFVFGLPAGRAYKVSFNRPYNTRTDNAGLGKRSFFYNSEYPMIRFLERNGYDVSYVSALDLENGSSELREHRVYVSCGQNEYWSAGMRSTVELAREAGVNLAFFSANDMFWKVRFENSIDGLNAPKRTLVCYKETHASAKIDPLPGVWTGTWRDSRFLGHDGRRPENAVIGTSFSVNGLRADAIQVPAEYGRLRLWRSTSVAALLPGQTATFPAGTLGFEWNEDCDNGWRPRGLFRLSRTAIDVNPDLINDFGSTYGPGRATHALTLYRHPSGALVFSAGSIQWSWGLDSVHDRGPCPADLRMQQATVNLFADMQVAAHSLMPGLVPASASTDAEPPKVKIIWPKNGDEVASCDVVTVTGNASDEGGGVVAGVEVSLNGGLTWNTAVGQTAWSYAWLPVTPGTYTLLARSIDDGGRVSPLPASVSVYRREFPSCAEMLFGPGSKPRQFTLSDPQAVELGVRFKPTLNGTILGIRFFKPAANWGDHQVHLWTNAGTELAAARLQAGPVRGWQEVLFDTPVPVTSGQTYVASYHAPGGGFPFKYGFFASAPYDNGHLRAQQDGVAGANGVFRYGASGFPTSTFSSTNYWVDVVFKPGP